MQIILFLYPLRVQPMFAAWGPWKMSCLSSFEPQIIVTYVVQEVVQEPLKFTQLANETMKRLLNARDYYIKQWKGSLQP